MILDLTSDLTALSVEDKGYLPVVTIFTTGELTASGWIALTFRTGRFTCECISTLATKWLNPISETTWPSARCTTTATLSSVTSVGLVRSYPLFVEFYLNTYNYVKY